jgi:FeS assembly SUF system protein
MPKADGREPKAESRTEGTMPDPILALSLRPKIIDAICSVYDPEIPVNIWEMGLIYDVDIDKERRVHIRMTLTAPACPSAQSLPLEVERKVRDVEGVADAFVEVVWEPAWTMDRMSEAAKLQLGMF